MNDKTFMTAEEAAKYMGITMSYLYKLTHLKMIPYTRPFGKKIYFEREAILSGRKQRCQKWPSPTVWVIEKLQVAII